MIKKSINEGINNQVILLKTFDNFIGYFLSTRGRKAGRKIWPLIWWGLFKKFCRKLILRARILWLGECFCAGGFWWRFEEVGSETMSFGKSINPNHRLQGIVVSQTMNILNHWFGMRLPIGTIRFGNFICSQVDFSRNLAREEK